MHIVIESTVGGSFAGFLHCTISGSENLGSLISRYCESKGIAVNSSFVLRDQKGVTLDATKTVSDYDIGNGDTIFIESQESQSGIFQFTNWWILAIGALLVASAGFAVVISLHVLKAPTPILYGIVLDGGSSHTALFVYRWDGPKWMGTGLINQIGSCNIPGDIASYYKNISGIDAFLSPCLKYASDNVPSASRSTSPIYFGATAGVRLLNISQPSAADVLLDGIRNRLSRSGFMFDPSNVEILSGNDEAQFSWITVNSQLQNVGPNSTVFPRKKEVYATVGAMDLGGASTQFSLEIPLRDIKQLELFGQPSGVWRENGVDNLELYGKNYSVYSQSSLCYGVLEVIKRYQSMLIATANESQSIIQSPCQPTGFSQSIKAEQIYNTPCAQNRTSSPTQVQVWTFNGTSNYSQCSLLVEQLFNTSFCQSHFLPPTCFSNPGQPSVSEHEFLAFSSFKVVSKNFNITNTSSLDDFRRSIQSVCNMTLDEINHLPFTVQNSSFVPLLCLESQYVLSLLTSGYGFDDKSWQGIYFVDQVAGAEIGWTLGYMTERTNQIAAAEAAVFLSTTAFVGLAVLFSLFFMTGLLLLYHAIWMKRSINTYSRLRHHTYGSLNLSL